MNRREFLTFAGGAAVFSAEAFSQVSRPRRVGFLFNILEDDPAARIRTSAFWEGVGRHGWDKATLQTEYFWGGNTADAALSGAKSLVALAPDVLVTSGSPTVVALSGLTKTIPIVFAFASGAAISTLGIQNYSRPGGNVSGFVSVEATESQAKTIDLLVEMMPRTAEVAVIYGPDAVPGGEATWIGAYRKMASDQNLTLVAYPVRSLADIKEAVGRVALTPAAGLIMSEDSYITANRLFAISELTGRRVPAIWGQQWVTSDGALIGYGADPVVLFHGAGDYAGLILNGAKPSDLPIRISQLSLSVNLRVANALGISVPSRILARADNVIE